MRKPRPLMVLVAAAFRAADCDPFIRSKGPRFRITDEAPADEIAKIEKQVAEWKKAKK